MRITLISGSPKKKGSTSETLLSILKSYLMEIDCGQKETQKENQDNIVQSERMQAKNPQKNKSHMKQLQMKQSQMEQSQMKQSQIEELQINELQLWQPQIEEKQIEELLKRDTLVFAFPLYIDSIPSHMLRCLIQIEDYIHLQQTRQNNEKDAQTQHTEADKLLYTHTKQNNVIEPRREEKYAGTPAKMNVFVIVNNGFFQGKQNVLAIEVMQHWAKRCGFCFRQAVGIGGGGMIKAIQSIPDGYGPKKNISLALKELAGNITQSQSGAIRFLEPNYPAWAYKWQAEHMWRAMIKRNGLKKKDIHKQW